MASEKNHDSLPTDNDAKHDTSSPSAHSAASLDHTNEKTDGIEAFEPILAAAPEGAHTLQKLDSKVVKADDKNRADPFAHLPEEEALVLRNQVDTPDVKVGYFTLFKYADGTDWAVFSLAVFCAIVAGAAMPLMTVVFGGLAGQFSSYFQGQIPYADFEHKLSTMVLYFIYLSIGSFITTYIYVTGFVYVGGHCAQKIREQYLRAMLRQNIGYFDDLGSGEVTTRITADTNVIQDGISEKLGLTLNALATFISAFVIAFVRSWKLTLILISGVVTIVVVMGVGGSTMVRLTQQTQIEYGKSGTVAEEVLSSIRNAMAFNTQEKLARQYDAFLKRAEKDGRRVQSMQGTMIAIMMCIVNLMYGLGFWEGSRLLVAGEVNVSKILTVNFAVIIGSFSLGNVAPNAKAFASAVAAGAKIFSSIARNSPMNPDSEDGSKPDSLVGSIELKGIKHIYPSRPEVTVMDGLDLLIPAGKQTALVGSSGSGKSSIAALVLRFYDPVRGQVLLDGRDIRDINLRWLRQQIALVQQEPVLFSTTIFENISYGLQGSQWDSVSHDKKASMIVDAAKMANAHEFITALPDGYDTKVGQRGFLLSGGQKQRIAIARAVVSDPRILLLDEATSALDTKSEGVVQAALDKAAQGRTTIVIAHRLSTIKNADNIVVMSNGSIVEQGSHDVLLDKKAAYFSLVEAQRIAAEQDAEGNDIEATEEVDTEKTEALKAIEKGTFIADPADADPAKLTRTQTEKSQSSLIMAQRKQEADKKYSLWTLIKLVWSFNRKEWPLAAAGFFFSAIAGAGQPVQSIFFAKSIQTISLPPNMYAKLRHDIDFWALMYLMLAFVLLIANASHAWAFGFCQEAIIHRARIKAFRTLLRQDVAFFDEEKNTSGGLTSFLSVTIIDLAGLSGSTLGTILMVSTTLVTGLIVSLVIGWKLALVCIGAIPILIGCGYLRFSMLSRFQARSKAAYEGSASYACEATSAIRTVASLSREGDVWDNYHGQLAEQGQKSFKSVLKSSLLFAASQSLVFLCVALGFWYGGTLIAKHEYSMFQFFVCFQSIIFGAQSAGTIFSFAPDMGKARHAAEDLKRLFDRKPTIDSWSEEGERMEHMDGYIEFRDVHFRYPTRPDQPVLRGLNLTVKPGQFIALVGASGCGKSTSIALMERFYDPVAVPGSGVFVDGKDISKLHLNTYRSHLALVSQEPTLYQGTIRENILLGADREDVPEEEIITACKNANIYDFIMSLPEGYATVCGSKGTLLSGGQKQRVAIARALLRNPKILLLDEATSALDSESEKVVQAALDAAARGRTTIAVAHRLSTIQKADVIYVIDAGKVVEQGTHNELLGKRGRYAELVTLQSLEKGA